MAEKTLDIPWAPTSRSYNIAQRIIEGGEKGEIPKDRSSQKDSFSSFAKDYGVTKHTLNNIMYTLRSTQRIPFSPLGRMDEPKIRAKLLKTNFLKVLDWKIGVIHDPGALLGMGRMREIAEQNGFNALVYGHTHSPSIKWEGNILFINPGSSAITKKVWRS